MGAAGSEPGSPSEPLHRAGSAEGRDGAADGLPVLWHLKVSHYNEKVRWALD
jgi:hypothetical protein